ncbi:MAG: 5'-nucleotidase C-terminal domain-containing protein [Lewinellaceae bacterium]|nr:5'-nucleotidase C-terminal domain-containing protein [Lewinellaceae bacterium]
MKIIRNLTLLLLLCFGISCDPAKKSAGAGGDDGVIEVQFLQMNDVYEISPAPSDNTGGLARVAALRKQLIARNPNTFTVLAGDFISPSIIGTLKYEGKRIRGRQMVEVLNALGLDWVVFGNHEFDYDDLSDLQARIDESNFTWLAANARLKGQTWTQQFFKNKAGGGTEICPDNLTVTVKDADGTEITLGVFGVLINTGRKPWVEYSDWKDAAAKNYAALKEKCDVVVALTHLDVADDKKLATMLPGISLVMGGHDHDNQIHRVGNSVVAKADANAKTVYVHTLRYNKKTKTATVKSELRRVNASLPDDPATAAVVTKWERIRNESLSSSGFDAVKPVITLKEPLDCREAVVRHEQCKAGEYITAAMMAAAKMRPDCAIQNSGAIRVDDVLSGTLTELDIVRMLPFGGSIVEVEMRGSMLRRTLDAGLGNKGKGGYLLLRNIRRDETAGKWLIGEKTLDEAKIYRVILPSFLLTGNEQNMDFLKASIDADGKSANPDIPVIHAPDPADKKDLRSDVRYALIAYLRAK